MVDYKGILIFSNLMWNKNEKKRTYYNCELCDYTTHKLFDYNRHLETIKHKTNENANIMLTKNESLYICECGKSFIHNSSLCRHKNVCTYINTNNCQSSDLIIKLIEGNSELQKMMYEVIKQGTYVNNTSNINSHNTNTFNMNLFLNEQCKDALNMSEFINSIQVSISDLEATGRLGYVDGISRIIVNKLKQLDLYKRPIHCCDLKREIFYIKNGGTWEKEKDNYPLMKQTVNAIACKNIGQIGEWMKLYPDARESDSSKNNMYHCIVSNAMSGETEEKQERNLNNIIRNIAKEVIIDKKL